MANRTQFGVGEWYHCYNRGVDKRTVFQSVSEYERFLSLLYLSNASERLHPSDFKSYSLKDLLKSEIVRGAPKVEIGAWCLMPNHVHLLLKEVEVGGIALFMQKVFTGYTMYFNKKNDRTGSLFAGTFKSKHVNSDRYFKHLVAYIHLNPIELRYPNWESASISLRQVAEILNHYEYSSFSTFENQRHYMRSLLSDSVFDMYDTVPKRELLLKNAREYFLEYNVKV